MVTKPTESIGKEEIKTMILEKVIPVIKEKFPKDKAHILIQLDNTKPHLNLNINKKMEELLHETEFTLDLMYQPPNSPDFNILDLGYFTSIPSLQQKKKNKKC